MAAELTVDGVVGHEGADTAAGGEGGGEEGDIDDQEAHDGGWGEAERPERQVLEDAVEGMEDEAAVGDQERSGERHEDAAEGGGSGGDRPPGGGGLRDRYGCLAAHEMALVGSLRGEEWRGTVQGEARMVRVLPGAGFDGTERGDWHRRRDGGSLSWGGGAGVRGDGSAGGAAAGPGVDRATERNRAKQTAPAG